MTSPGRCVATCLAAMLCVGSFSLNAVAQTVPDVTAQSIASTALIDDFVRAHVASMNSGDREKVVAGRQALLLPGTPNAKSAAFLAAYSKSINAQLMAVASGKDAHARLNAAIVVGKVAEMGGTPDLSPIIIKLASDDAAPIAAYGIRAAGPIVPQVLSSPTLATSDKIVPTIEAAMKKHAASESVVIESYNALTSVLSNRDLSKNLTTAQVNAATPLVVESLVRMLSARVPQYGTDSLVEPQADLIAIVFLTRQNSWAAMSPQTQKATVAALLEISKGAVAELTLEFAKKPGSRSRMAALQDVIKKTGQGLSVIGNFVKDATLTAAADRLKPLNTLTAPADWDKEVKAIATAFQTAFKINGSAATKPAVN